MRRPGHFYVLDNMDNTDTIQDTPGTIRAGEPHPASLQALEYVRNIPFPELTTYQCAFASAALSGNRLAEVCSETLERLITGKPVSDRYMLGLAWAIRSIRDKDVKNS